MFSLFRTHMAGVAGRPCTMLYVQGTSGGRTDCSTLKKKALCHGKTHTLN